MGNFHFIMYILIESITLTSVWNDRLGGGVNRGLGISISYRYDYNNMMT